MAISTSSHENHHAYRRFACRAELHVFQYHRTLRSLLFASRFPDNLLKREKMLIDEGDCITAGGVSAYMDLSLYPTARFGSPELAASLSKILLIDPSRRLPSPYQTAGFCKNHGNAEIQI